MASSSAAAAASATALVYGFLVMSPAEFVKLLSALDKPVVVVIAGMQGIVNKRRVYTYAAPLGGLVAVTRSPEPLQLPGDAVVVKAEKLVAPAQVYSALGRVLREVEAGTS